MTQRLRELLEEMDSEAGSWLEAHASLLAAAFPEHHRAIFEAVESFDFDEAASRLEAAVQARRLG